MRVLQVLRGLPWGGDPIYAARLICGMREIGVESTALTGGGPASSLFEGLGLSLWVEPSLSPETAPALAARVCAEGWDVILAHHYRSSRIARALSRASGVPWVMAVHARRGPLQRALVNYWSDPVIAVGGGIEANLRGVFGPPRDRIRRVRHIVDCGRCFPGEDTPPPDLPREPGDRVILHASRLEGAKLRTATELIAAMPRVLERHPTARLALVGHGREIARARAAAERLGRTWGEVLWFLEPRPCLANLMRCSDITVGPGLVAREALACGCPVIAAGRAGFIGPVDETRFEGVCEDTNFGDHGVGEGRPTAARFARDIVSVLDDYCRWKREAEALAVLVARDCSTRAVAEGIVAILQEACGRRGET